MGGFPAPVEALPRIREKSLPLMGMRMGMGAKINPRAGMGIGTRVNFHPIPILFPYFGRCPYHNPYFFVPGWEKIPILASFS